LASKGPGECPALPLLQTFYLQIARKQRADERTRTAHPCSSYEFACARSSASLCVRELRLFMRFLMIRRSRFVHCVLVRISPVAVRLPVEHQQLGGEDRGSCGLPSLLLLGDGGIENSPGVGPRGGWCGRHAGGRKRCVATPKYSGPANYSCQVNVVERPFYELRQIAGYRLRSCSMNSLVLRSSQSRPQGPPPLKPKTARACTPRPMPQPMSGQ
jgi:hypothetical protein